jgi:hypothetical protein
LVLENGLYDHIAWQKTVRLKNQYFSFQSIQGFIKIKMGIKSPGMNANIGSATTR